MLTKIRLTLLGAFALALTSPLFTEIINENTPVPEPGAVGAPTPGLTSDELDQWVRGRKVFDRDWFLSAGLGPDLNGDSCRACHQIPIIGGGGGLDVNVFRFARDFGGLGPFTDLPGGQIGSKIRTPDNPGREDHPDEADLFEQRQSPPLFGAGAIETIADSTILAGEDLGDADGDGIFGYARMLDVAGSLEIGRFGWKGQIPTLEDFLRDAMGAEIGITTPDDGRGFAFTSDTDAVADPELVGPDFDDLLFYLQNIAPPPRAGNVDPLIAVGEQVFEDIGCAVCHTPTLMGSQGPVPLYSNLLMHDVHDASFRGMAEPGADVGFYRTPPLWGLRFSAPYFHDGRAETIQQAIDAHAGEANQVMDNYDALNSMEKSALVEFLKDL